MSEDLEIAFVGYCPICGQGRQFIARDTANGQLFVYCEDCESEWSNPLDAANSDRASFGTMGPSVLVSVQELSDHPWLPQVMNR